MLPWALRAIGRVFVKLFVRRRVWIAEFPVLDLEFSAGIHGELFDVGSAGFVSVKRGGGC